MESLSGLIILLAALLLDVAAGDAPNRFHPVAWLGHAVEGGRNSASMADAIKFGSV